MPWQQTKKRISLWVSSGHPAPLAPVRFALGVEGETPLGGNWGLDWSGGGAVLFGERKLDQTYAAANPFGTSIQNLSSSSNAAVFNADGQLGVSDRFTGNLKLSASYRVDAYFNALQTFNAAGGTVNANRIYSGPMLRLMGKY